MTWVDLIIVGVVAISALISLMRGFVREVLSLAVWLGAFWIAALYTPDVAARLTGVVDSDVVRLTLGFLGLFVAVLLVGIAVSILATHLIKVTSLNAPNRMLGVIFGVARGIVVALVLVTVVGLTPLSEGRSWTGSMLVGYCQQLAAWFGDWVPWGEVREFFTGWRH